MQKMAKEELKELINKVSDEVSEIYSEESKTGDKNVDAVFGRRCGVYHW